MSLQRRDAIHNQVLQFGHVTVKELVDDMGMSEATIRRDLRALADSGQVELVYGGATLPRVTDFSFRSKSQRHVAEKRRIGELAASMVQDGETLLLDSGTTVSEMAPFLRRKRGLTIIVNSTRLAVDLGAMREVATIIALGGQYRSDRMDTVGPLAVAALEQLRGYRAFVGADGLSMDFGITAGDIDSSHLYKLAIRHAREAVLLVDHTKFQTPSLFKICEVEHISRLVTDRKPTTEWMRFLNDKGVEVLFPSDGSSNDQTA